MRTAYVRSNAHVHIYRAIRNLTSPPAATMCYRNSSLVTGCWPALLCWDFRIGHKIRVFRCGSAPAQFALAFQNQMGPSAAIKRRWASTLVLAVLSAQGAKGQRFRAFAGRNMTTSPSAIVHYRGPAWSAGREAFLLALGFPYTALESSFPCEIGEAAHVPRLAAPRHFECATGDLCW